MRLNEFDYERNLAVIKELREALAEKCDRNARGMIMKKSGGKQTLHKLHKDIAGYIKHAGIQLLVIPETKNVVNIIIPLEQPTPQSKKGKSLKTITVEDIIELFYSKQYKRLNSRYRLFIGIFVEDPVIEEPKTSNSLLAAHA